MLPTLQVWLLLYNLLADGAARSKMDLTEARGDALLRLRRHLNELLLDQVSWTSSSGGGCVLPDMCSWIWAAT